MSNKEAKEYLEVLHREDTTWEKSIMFYRDEIAIFKKRLSEISSKYTDKEVKALVSHFESTFWINLRVLDELIIDISKREEEIVKEIESNPVAYEHRKIQASAELKGKFNMFERLYTGLKNEFNTFSAKYM